MLTKMIAVSGVIMLVVLGTMLGLPSQGFAFTFTLKIGSVDGTFDLGAGGNSSTDIQLALALDIREIGGFCKNPAGQSSTAKGKPYQLSGFSVHLSNSNSFTQTSNGHILVTLSTTNPDIQRAFDIYNALNGKPFVNLQSASQACPNGNWTWNGFGVTKVDVAGTYVKVPSGTDSSGTIHSGTANYLTTNCRPVSVPALNPDGTYQYDSSGNLIMTTVTTCDFVGEPWTYCSRFVATQGPDGHFADSGLRIYDNDLGTATGTPNGLVPVSDPTYKVQDCYLWRDVNKLASYNLINFGTYDPDTANLVSPQQGTKDVGGAVLLSPFTTYTGECHQHGKENSNKQGYNWNQSGPQKKICDASNNLIAGDPMCTGGSQLLNGTYALTCP